MCTAIGGPHIAGCMVTAIGREEVAFGVLHSLLHFREFDRAGSLAQRFAHRMLVDSTRFFTARSATWQSGEHSEGCAKKKNIAKRMHFSTMSLHRAAGIQIALSLCASLSLSLVEQTARQPISIGTGRQQKPSNFFEREREK